MINENKWLNSLPKTNQEFSKTSNHLDNDIKYLNWVNQAKQDLANFSVPK